MMRSVVAAAVLLGAAACGPSPQPASAPLGAEEAIPLSALEPPPVHALIGHRQTLGLTSEQITALDSIGQHLHAENQPHMRRMTELREQFRGRTGRDPRAGEPLPRSDSGRPVMEEIRQNNREALQGVREVLTEEQQARTCELFRDTDRRRQGRQETGRQADRTAARGPRAAQRGLAPGPVWSWCVEQPAQASS